MTAVSERRARARGAIRSRNEADASFLRRAVSLACGQSGALMVCCGLLLQDGFVQPAQAQDHGFAFVRIAYNEDRSLCSEGGFGWGGRGRRSSSGRWSVDCPTAELNLHEAIRRTTTLHIESEPVILSLKDERIFEYPVLYMAEPGHWPADEEDLANLAEYLERGGFIIFDHFRGQEEWNHWQRQMQHVLPDQTPVPVLPDHPIWNIYYDVDPVEAPALLRNNEEPIGKYQDEYYAYFDENGRMMVFICYFQDLADGWEWPNHNLWDASTVSFQMGINFLMYAFTH
jgi:hypothetical protein